VTRRVSFYFKSTLCRRWNFHDYYRHRFSCVFVASLYRERFCVSIYELILRVKNCLQRGCVCVCVRERERESAYFVYIYERFPFFVRCTFRFFTTRVMTNFAGLIIFFYGIILLRPLPSRPQKFCTWTGGTFFISRLWSGRKYSLALHCTILL